ncbi:MULTISPECIES: UvrD-helicase domain-containing protein [Bacillaceae]|uniref:DNA 3'-5' helicase n=1 Tax=Evansella alkalicola TaxID=745819 RepID=A0ABS6JWT2_9BACI|nr:MULTISPECIES: UvrD-helicase domain-containing protein [Bacillaceae]MBU9723053.1 UvrD-helicase domain-containing protein [Bacillus alkalicola]
MGETETQFKDLPQGAELNKELKAKMAPADTSDSLVKNHEFDAPYFRELEKKGIHLNKPQIEAVRHFEGPLLTLAGAGSGKTSVLVCRTGYLISVQKVKPTNILLVTFTRKAADEMKERISKLPGLTRQHANQVQANTFHAFFLRLLKSRGYDQEILSSERQKQITIKIILRELGLEDTYQPETLIALLSSYKMNMISMDKIPEKTKVDQEAKEVFKRYESWKKTNHKIDFDDILVEAYQLLQRDPQLLQALQKRFTQVMVDEFQDTNLLQYELIKMIAKAHLNLFVVGDDDQTIYSFNGARNEFILEFTNEFKSAKTVTLDINYRSPDTIVGLGNAVIEKNTMRKKKTLQVTRESSSPPQFGQPPTTDEEAVLVVEDIQQKVEAGTHQYGDFAILHRAASNSRAIFEQLTMEEIPFLQFSMNDQLFYDHWTVKPIVDHLRLSINPREFSAMESILPTLYINREKGMHVIHGQELGNKKKYPLIHLMKLASLKDYQRKKVEERIQLIKSLSGMEPQHAIKKLRQKFYESYVEADDRQTLTVHKETVKEMLDELEASSKRFGTISSFLSFIDDMNNMHKKMKELNKTPDANVVKLMTIHRSKGLEFPVVYLIGASEGILPHTSALEAGKMEDNVSFQKNNSVKHAIEEERRLAYVAITRAMNELIITSPEYNRGKSVRPSRFILEPFEKEKTSGAVKKKIKIHDGKKRKRDGATENGEQLLITVLAWICTKDGCRAWTRIRTEVDQKLSAKKCPLCQSEMEQGEKKLLEKA